MRNNYQTADSNKTQKVEFFSNRCWRQVKVSLIIESTSVSENGSVGDNCRSLTHEMSSLSDWLTSQTDQSESALIKGNTVNTQQYKLGVHGSIQPSTWKQLVFWWQCSLGESPWLGVVATLWPLWSMAWMGWTLPLNVQGGMAGQ